MKLTIRAATASAHQRPSTPYAARLTRLIPARAAATAVRIASARSAPTRHPGSDSVLGDRKRREHQDRGDQQDGPDRRRPWMILGGECPKTTDDQVRGQDKQRQPDRPLRGLLDAVGSMRLARFDREAPHEDDRREGIDPRRRRRFRAAPGCRSGRP